MAITGVQPETTDIKVILHDRSPASRPTGRQARRCRGLVPSALAATAALLAIALGASLLVSTSARFFQQPTLVEQVFRQSTLDDHYSPYGFIAHAMGTVRGQGYTNSPEAFLRSYDKGFRLFETDLVMLADGTVLAAHPGLEAYYGLDHPFTTATLDEIHPFFPNGHDLGLSVLTGEGIVQLLAEHSDAILVTDTKDDHAQILRSLVNEAHRRGTDVADRIVPHVRDPSELSNMAAVYPFGAYILALYRSQAMNELNDDEVIDFIRANHLPAVMMWWKNRDDTLTLEQNTQQNRRFSASFLGRIRAAGAVVYVHSLSNGGRIKSFKAVGVGVYSDGFFGSEALR